MISDEYQKYTLEYIRRGGKMDKKSGKVSVTTENIFR